jgi:ferrochelatase
MENRDVFLAAGGKKYHYIPALNARPDHVAALRDVVLGKSHVGQGEVQNACFG